MSLSGTILVTGGNGFLGSNVIRHVLGQKVSIHAVGLGSTHNISDIDDKVTYHEVDLTNQASVKSLCAQIKPDHVFHLAALVNTSRSANETELAKHNVLVTKNLLDSVGDIASFTIPSTSDEYGLGSAPFKESFPSNPQTPYARTKAAATAYCLEKTTDNVPISILRLFQVYGPYQSARMLLPYVITQALQNKDIITTPGEQTRDFVFIEDVVSAFVSAALNPSGSIINIATGSPTRVADAVRLIMSKINSTSKVTTSLPYRCDEPKNFYADIQKAKDVLGWQPKISIDEGLTKTIDWYKARVADNSLSNWLA